MSTSLNNRTDIVVLIGQEIVAKRESRGLNKKDVANALLLSTAQIDGIELGCLKPFYNERFHRQCADKYAAYLGVTPLLSERFYEAESAEPEEPPEVLIPMASPAEKPLRLLFPVKLIVAGALILTALALYLSTPSQLLNKVTDVQDAMKSLEKPKEPPPTLQSQQVEINKAPAEELKTLAAYRTVLLKFNGLCWIQSVDINGQESERTYRSGETMEIIPNSLQALIIGNHKAVTILSETGAEINVDKFTNPNSNVVRIIGDPIRKIGKNN